MASEIYTITFLRHGESVGNLEGRFQGQADFPLTDKGRLQAQALAERWKSEGATFDQAIASPLIRAKETAEIICAVMDIPLEFDPDWREINNGLMAGLTQEEGEVYYPRPVFMTPYTRFGRTGESRWELYLRAGRCIQKLLEQPAGRYLVVAHGGILNMAMYAMLSITPQADYHGPRFTFENTTYVTMVYEPEHHNWRMLLFDGRSHWKED